MKKTYMKPILVIESFQLDAAVATSCSSQENGQKLNHGENSCGFLETGNDNLKQWQYFNNNNCEVDLTGSGGDGNDIPCYHGPFLTGNLTFISS